MNDVKELEDIHAEAAWGIQRLRTAAANGMALMLSREDAKAVVAKLDFLERRLEMLWELACEKGGEMQATPNYAGLADAIKTIRADMDGNFGDLLVTSYPAVNTVLSCLSEMHDSICRHQQSAQDELNQESIGDNSLMMNEYQNRAHATALYEQAIDAMEPEKMRDLLKLAYPVIGLVGEAGEVANKAKKLIRGDSPVNEDRKLAMRKDLGGTLWYLAEAASALGFSLDSVGRENLGQLADRKARGTLQGDGDER